MTMPPKTYEIPVVIEKADLASLIKTRGKVNADVLVLAGHREPFPPRSLVFVDRKLSGVFRTKRFKGVFQFADADPDATYETFSTLPGIIDVRRPLPKSTTSKPPTKETKNGHRDVT